MVCSVKSPPPVGGSGGSAVGCGMAVPAALVAGGGGGADGGFGIAGWIGAVLPLALTVSLTALEMLVAFLQAYVFTILTCIYLNDAIHPGH